MFDVAADMVEAHPVLRGLAKVYRSRIAGHRVIYVPRTSSTYKVLSADAFTKHGLNAHGIVFDELHAQPNRDLWDVLTTSVGARTQPLVFGITTAGFDRTSICWEIHEYAEKVIGGVVDDPSFFGYIRGAPDDADWRDERVWRDANPAIGSGFRSIEEMRDLARRAAEAPELQNTFRRLYLNQWTGQRTRFLSLEVWDENGAAGELTGDVFAGLDLASTTDVAAFVLYAPDTGAVVPHLWAPEAALEGRDTWRRALRTWADEGYVNVVPGDVIEFAAIRERILEVAHDTAFRLREIAYDPWQAEQMAQELDTAGLAVWEHRQTMAHMSEPTKLLRDLVLGRKLRHAGHPVLRWMVDNLSVKTDSDGNLKPDRKTSGGKIDGAVALIMAISAALRPREPEKGEPRIRILGEDDASDA